MSNDSPSPADLYGERVGARRVECARLERRDARLANVRLLTALAAVPLGYAVFSLRLMSAWAFAPLAAVFLALVIAHDRVKAATVRVKRSIRFFERGLERLAESWPGKGRRGDAFIDPHHPYALDLDLFGEGSLFELLCLAHTRGGEARLAAWLLAPSDADEVRDRQAAVRELAPNVDLREDLFVGAGEVAPSLHPDILVRWAEAPAALTRGRGTLTVALVVMALIGLAALVGWATTDIGPVPFLLVLVVNWAIGRTLTRRLSPVLGRAEEPRRELRVLASLLERLEQEPMRTPKLSSLRGALTTDGPASRSIARLARLIEVADARKNQLFAPVAYALNWGPLSALAIEAWRARHGARVRRWLDAVSELEALASLAAYSFERPAATFPELVPGARYEARGLAHPLLGAEAVPNDVTLGEPLRLLVISGSNMSGKSTLLRSVGVSVVMALAGAPVRATSLVLSPLALGATLRVQDSLMGGASRFYAEIQRLEQLLEMTDGSRPLLFLLDEILHGTNSHDRRHGAAAVVHAFLERGALGLITTHDLALAELAEREGARAANVHFEDELRNGRLAFDYTMRSGVVTKSNAIELMRAVGLPV